MRLGDYVSHLLTDTPGGNNSSLLRSRAAEWAAEQAERLKDKGLIGLSRRIAISHTAPAFVIDQHRRIIGCNKQFEDLVSASTPASTQARLAGMDVRLGVPMSELGRILREQPEKFLRANFADQVGRRRTIWRAQRDAGWRGKRPGALSLPRAVYRGSATLRLSLEKTSDPEMSSASNGPDDEKILVAHHEAKPDA